MSVIRVNLPPHLRTLAGVDAEVLVDVGRDAPSIRRVLDGLEALHPPLAGTIRDHASGERRPYMRYAACGRDLSLTSPDDPLPPDVASGAEVFRVLGAIAGG